jgi:hypothetical protein
MFENVIKIDLKISDEKQFTYEIGYAREPWIPCEADHFPFFFFAFFFLGSSPPSSPLRAASISALRFPSPVMSSVNFYSALHFRCTYPEVVVLVVHSRGAQTEGANELSQCKWPLFHLKKKRRYKKFKFLPSTF